MSNQSDTPETDALMVPILDTRTDAIMAFQTVTTHARNLERQRDLNRHLYETEMKDHQSLMKTLSRVIRERDEWKRRFIPFAIVHSAAYGKDHYGDGCLHYEHYDMLEEAGARMDDFERCGEPEKPRNLYHSPACQLADKCQCDEPEMEMTREELDIERGEREYQMRKDEEL